MFSIIVLLLLSATDIKYRRIPKNFTITLLIFLSCSNPNRIPIAILVFLFFSTIRCFSKFSIGYGDVRLSPVAALTSESALKCTELLFLSWFFAGIWLLLRWRKREKSLPFAPFLTLSVIFQAS
ncbi:MAG: prepilin peptidase [Candidatus Nanopelagicaceae bacterium]